MAWWASPILAPAVDGAPGRSYGSEPAFPTPGGKGLRTAGYIYVQAPVDLDRKGAAAPLSGSILPLLAPGGLVLALVVPVGVVFGMLSTRRLIGRITRLAGVTTAVARGDFGHRVPVSGSDEVGRLEDGFNRMTEQLGAAVEAKRRAARADARQAERSRIARELHDSISQDLFSLSLLAGGMRRAAPERLQREAKTMERTVARTMREMRALLLELRPVALEDAGLVPAIRKLCHAYQTRLGVAVRASLDEVPLSPAAEHAVLRLTQEALGNAIKHGAVRPEVLLLDMVMPGMDGLDVLRRLGPERPAVIVLTSFQEDERVVAAVRLGALSYLPKTTAVDQVVEAVRAAARGESVLSPGVAALLMRQVRQGGRRTPMDSLTPREREVLTALARGRSNGEIARALSLGRETVKTHVSSILAKLGLTDRTQAAIFALQQGLVPLAEALEPGTGD
ncbi:hypothetical protein Sme01_38190 [Sphaerisporangium melleum]|uniref:Histidine kinase n=1 Tax=Sphaerisporangium melleum TaxID=321316 RepID=A0A917R0L7_9ACTN|nr:LuxR C-terminal-related transcriptional regulator [Sphaerisporangium melleum]GGK82391.1 hypothetical protein GCM10007964_26300 [Sphaerisporangium melleum]GII71343.1 hypothetical protein Sme01_38190 [Sphaerisporangium melleum]